MWITQDLGAIAWKSLGQSQDSNMLPFISVQVFLLLQWFSVCVMCQSKLWSLVQLEMPETARHLLNHNL